MPAYQISVRSRSTGAVLVVTDRFRTLNVEHRTNDISNLALGLTEDDPVTQYLDESNDNLDNIIEVRRSAPEYGIDWYREYSGFHRTAQRQITTGDHRILTSYSRGFLDLIKRRSVRYYADTDGSAKGPAPADDVIKEYVYENAGAGATAGTSPLRVTNGVTPGLVVAPNLGQAASYEGAHAWRNLLEAIRDIGEGKSVDFDVVWGGSAAPLSWEFRTYYPMLGTDRRSGTANPVIFAPHFANMQNPSHTRSRTEEVSSVLVLGPGEGPSRDTTLRTSTHTTDSPYNLIELDHNASSEDREAALNDAGDGVLHEKRPAISFTFDVIQTPHTSYGKHYFLGDLVTAAFSRVGGDIKIRAVRLNASDDRETITLELEAVV